MHPVPLIGPALRFQTLLAMMDPVLYRHGVRVGKLAHKMGEGMGLSGLALHRLELAARLHDIGKLFLPKGLVHKATRFSREEYRIVQRHAVLGARLLEGHPAMAELAQVARHHHARWDGKGYPSRLQRDAIPLAARITCVADAFDAMTSHRCGGNQSREAARQEILRCRGTQFCPECVDALLAIESWSEWAS